MASVERPGGIGQPVGGKHSTHTFLSIPAIILRADFIECPAVLRSSNIQEKVMEKKPKQQAGFSEKELGEAIKGGRSPSNIWPIRTPS